MEAIETVKETLTKGLDAVEGLYGDTKTRVDEFATENYPRLSEELGKLNITLPELEEVKSSVGSVTAKVEELAGEIKTKIEEALDKLEGEKATSEETKVA